ncbi:hypothetical protein SCLCIDRAFT_50108, partial [Scleroderma citrinum Foug A]
RQMRIWSKLRHDHVLPLLGITTDFDRTVSFVTPWMAKGHGYNYVQDKAIDPRPLILGIAQGLQYLHSHTSGAIVHGNVKGSNALISNDGQALLHDFHSSLLRSSSLVSGPHGGTLNWMAPEILDNSDP